MVILTFSTSRSFALSRSQRTDTRWREECDTRAGIDEINLDTLKLNDMADCDEMMRGQVCDTLAGIHTIFREGCNTQAGIDEINAGRMKLKDMAD